MPTLWAKTRTTLEMIKWEHSIFALPFALTATILAANGLPTLRTLVWILAAMVTARSCAMAFNRWADADLDAANPRTRTRAIPAGLLSRQFVLGFTLHGGVVFVLASAELNRLTLYLSPVVLIVLLGYSYMKRLTRWSHLVLGLALGLAPSAAWIAVRGASTRASWCSPPRLRSGWAASMSSTPARTSSTTAPPASTACPGGGHSRRLFGRPRHASGHAGPARLVRATVSISDTSAGWASPPWPCCWPMSIPLFRPATCAGSMPPFSP